MVKEIMAKVGLLNGLLMAEVVALAEVLVEILAVYSKEALGVLMVEAVEVHLNQQILQAQMVVLVQSVLFGLVVQDHSRLQILAYLD